MAVRLVRRRFTVEEYDRMAEAGILVDVYRTPAPDGYRSVQRTAGEDTLTVQALPELAFQVQDLLT